MYKLVLIFALGLISYYNVNTDNSEIESKELKEWVYWDAFSNKFNETADYWQAESAALEAEKIATERTDIEDFLKEIERKEEVKKM